MFTFIFHIATVLQYEVLDYLFGKHLKLKGFRANKLTFPCLNTKLELDAMILLFECKQRRLSQPHVILPERFPQMALVWKWKALVFGALFKPLHIISMILIFGFVQCVQ